MLVLVGNKLFRVPEMEATNVVRRTSVPAQFCHHPNLPLSSISSSKSLFQSIKFPKKAEKSRITLIKASQSQHDQSSTTTTTSRKQRRPQNIAGEFFVDHTCIDCDTCRWMAPEIFTRVDGMSAVFKQPTCKEERLKGLQALLSCPTSSIHTEKPPPDILQAQDSFPIPIDEQTLPGVYHCGYHSEKSYGAASYLIVHPKGNILIDSPRFTELLARKIEMLGGACCIFLTHKDDVADHEKWSKRLCCDRILHSADVEVSTAEVEIKLEGTGSWNLADDVQLIHTPGHTQGSVCLFYKSLKILFTGDHMGMTESGTMSIWEQYNQCSVPMQLENVWKLLDLDFKWILPGHGRRVEFKDGREKRATLEDFLQKKSSQFLHV